ncbi:cytochrome c oxidase subunit 3 family protein [Thiohalophilus thiocyanatoxydans]|uniref:Nitric oxide reductase NorE protein n=1 Tax=Thiohalophilus thiocyanatoxydans TaxID=381308 RepID=A0A4R8IP02_9GAMM|nr:cytochrome c oxidase subunit 3 family protein [Thiohalophilus thiocyanatoxydans]TDX98197.1 nitric oxide reductase NorE protein [Thiohalophilus thiocyanatoxydans]
MQQTTALTAGKEDYPPGDFVIWIVIYAELLAFGIFFLSYAFARSQNVELFNASQLELNRTAGAINTLVLITSSYFVVRSIAAIRENLQKQAARWMWAAIGLGSIFIVIKLFEFYTKYDEGITLSSNTFYMFYLSMTFFHFMHVILGLVILTIMATKIRHGDYTAQEHDGMETGANYWHMVDLVWIILFPLVYVIR